MRFKIKPYLDLCRISNLPTVWTNVLAAIVLSGGSFSWSHLLVLALSMSLFYSGGMCLNDLCDATVDRLRKPFRPIPSGKISVQDARIFTTILFGVALALLLILPFRSALLAALFLLALIVVYDRVHKKHPWSIFLMAGCRLMVFVVSSSAVSGKVNGAVGIAGCLQFFYVLILSLVARYENRTGKEFSFPVIPVMIASISILDGIVMAFFVSPLWLLAGCAGAVLTHLGQRYVKGD